MGQTLGGMFAMAFAHLYPERSLGLLGLCPMLPHPDKDTETRMPIMHRFISVLDGGDGGTDTFVFETYGQAYEVDFEDESFTRISNGQNISAIFNFENISAGNGNDILSGNDSDNSFDGNIGNDTLNGRGGDDTLDGGDGDDTAVFSGSIAGYTVSETGGVYTITDTHMSDGDDGTDTLTNIEVFAFSDITFPATVWDNVIFGNATVDDILGTTSNCLAPLKLFHLLVSKFMRIGDGYGKKTVFG